jgi:hypothetical protein
MWLIVDLDRGAVDGWYCSRAAADGAAASYRGEGLRVIVVMQDDELCEDTDIGQQAWLGNRGITD